MAEETQDQAAREREHVMSQPHSGTSPFTTVDDEGAPMHPSTVAGTRAIFHGDEMPPKHQLAEVIVGPPPFGSPDPRTLAHTMVPMDVDDSVAPELDADFRKLQKANYAGTASSESLDEMTKDELKNYAEARGIEVSSSATKDELREAIDSASSQNVSEESDTTTEAEEAEKPNYNGMRKDELLAQAEQRKLGVDETNSKAEIVEALEKDDNK